MSRRWEPARFQFPHTELDAFLVWAAEQGASDIAFQTAAPAMIEVDGKLRAATDSALDGPTMGRLVEAIHGPTGEGRLRAGSAIDCSHAVGLGRAGVTRFRCNMAPVQVDKGFGVNITLRVLPGAPPDFEALNIEAEIVHAWDLCRGLTLVTGVPGSGKSTLLAAGTRRLLERGAGRIQSYEAPIEYTFEGVAGEGALMSSSEIGRHFESFAEGLRSSLRRRPAAVIVGEARDYETVSAVVRAADYGIAVFSTAHTIGVAATIRRMLAEFPPEERAERGVALLDVLNLVVTQCLLVNPQGGRSAIREWLCFDESLKAEMLDRPQALWPATIEAVLRAKENSLAIAAGRAFEARRITEADYRRLAAGSAGPGAIPAAGVPVPRGLGL